MAKLIDSRMLRASKRGALAAFALFALFAVPCVSRADHPIEEEFGQRVMFFVGNGFEDGDIGDYFRRQVGCVMLRNQEGFSGHVAYPSVGGTARPFAVTAGATYRLTIRVFNLGMKTAPASPAGGYFPSSVNFYTGGKAYPAAWDVVKTYNFRNADTEFPQIVRASPLPASWTDVTVEFTVPAGSSMFDFSIPGGNATTGFGPFLLSNVTLTEVTP